jgi:RNA polymerase sigma factor (sigma-70 family)
MDRKVLLNNFYVSHSVWIQQCAYNLTNDQDKKDDLIQDTFIKLLELSNDRFEKVRFGENDLNTFFFYTTMKNHNINLIKKNREDVILNDTDTIDDKLDDSITERKERLLEALNRDINSYLDSMEQDNKLWFSAKLFRVYLEEDHTMDSLAAKTGISRSTIFTSLKNIKAHLREVFQKQYDELGEDEY